MAEDASRSRLGRELASLIGDMGAEHDDESSVVAVNVACRSSSSAANLKIRASIFPTSSSTSSRIRSANAASFSRSSCARCRGAETFEIIVSERRWRAARAALYDIPVVVVEANDSEAIALAIIENVQRADLNPIERRGKLSGSRRSIQIFAGRHRARCWQKPQPHREYDAGC